jgi:tRNA wybutosine-synthesizing protein 2
MKGKVIGDILVLKKNVDNPQELLKIPGVNRVVRLGRIKGVQREPDVEVIIGDGTETVHGRITVFSSLMFPKLCGPRENTTERKRMSQLVEDGETVVDLFSGIWLFYHTHGSSWKS